jgi:bacterioferritin-associated ferredoxin
MYVCLCAGITDKQIEQAARSGARTVEALGAELGVGTVCGCCRDAAACIAERAVAGGSCSIAELRRFVVAA